MTLRLARAARAQQGLALGQQVSSNLAVLPVKMLGRLLAQPGALNSLDFEEALRLAMAQVDGMDGKDCIRVLGALSQSPTIQVSPASQQLLGARLSERLDDISSAMDMSNS